MFIIILQKVFKNSKYNSRSIICYVFMPLNHTKNIKFLCA